LGIHPDRLTGLYIEEACIEFVHPLQKASPTAADLSWAGGLLGVEGFDVETLRRDIAGSIPSVIQEPPKLLDSVRSWEPAAGTNYGNGLSSNLHCLAHLPHLYNLKNVIGSNLQLTWLPNFLLSLWVIANAKDWLRL
jgi:hypothetical protein